MALRLTMLSTVALAWKVLPPAGLAKGVMAAQCRRSCWTTVQKRQEIFGRIMVAAQKKMMTSLKNYAK